MVSLKITDGNIFEAMRLVLPEHRSRMKDVERELRKRSKPKLSDDHLREMAYILAECASESRAVRVTLFDEYDDEIWYGIPMVKQDRLFLQRGDEIWPLATDRLIRIEPV